MLSLKYIFIIFLLATFALSDSGSFGGEGANVFPLKGTQVEMVKENVLIYQDVDENTWNVECTFIFLNSGKETEVLMGFPDSPTGHDEEDSAWYDKGTITDFYCEVDSVEVDWELKSGVKSPSDPNLEEYPHVYVWPVSFKAGQQRTVTNKYSFNTSWDSYWATIYYVLTTGALWKGPIGEGTVKIVPFGGRFIQEFSSISPKGYKIKRDTIVWHFKKLEPDEDIRLSYDATSQGWYCRAKEALLARSPEEVKGCLHHYVRSFPTGEISSEQYYLSHDSETIIELVDSLFWLYREMEPNSYLILPVAYHLSLQNVCDTLVNKLYAELKNGTIDDSINYRFIARTVCAKYLEKYSLARQIIWQSYRHKLRNAQAVGDRTVYEALERLRKIDLDSITIDSIRQNPTVRETLDSTNEIIKLGINKKKTKLYMVFTVIFIICLIIIVIFGILRRTKENAPHPR